jgi:diguanylate cyclase (GGDEF)-like protein
MGSRLRLLLAPAVVLLATGAVALGLWHDERGDARAETRGDARTAARAVEQRASAALLALQGLRAGYDADGLGPLAQAAHSDVAFARPEIVALGWAPRVPAAERSSVEAAEQIRIGAPQNALFTYPLLSRWPQNTGADVIDLGTNERLAQALREARTNGQPRLSAPIRLQGNGGLGVFAFAPVFARDLPVGTPGERRDALRGVVVAALSADTLVHEATDRTDVRVADGQAVLSAGADAALATTTARVGGRAWQISVPKVAPSPLVPLLFAGTGAALALLLLLLRRPVPAAASVRSIAERIASAVALEPDPVELFTIVAEEAGVELRVPAVTLVRFETGGFGTVVGAWEAHGELETPPGAPVDLDDASPAGKVYASGHAAPGAAPIRVGNKPWGVLVAEGADPATLAALAEIAQSAVAYADASARLNSLGTRDALTNLPDHRAFHEQLRAEVRRAQRHERALSLVLVNLDGFRRVNEEHGRLAGDRALAEAARRLAAAVRQGEIVSRLGADHFGWILPETEGLNGWIGAERARRSISSTPFDGIGDMTASAGVADLHEVSGPDELLALAEVALAHAKSSGGDATFRHSDELERSEADAADEERGLKRLRALARELDAEDPGTEGHSERVARLAEKLAVVAGWSAEDAVRLAQAAAVHDVGKLGVDDDVLRKSGPLDEQELEQIRNHPDTGAEIAVKALDPEQLAWVRHHHERWDGTGYPGRLSGDLIPAGARLLALAEAWDSMTSSRLHADALPTREALEECRRESGTQFAPEAVEALERLWTLGALEQVADVRAASVDY